MATVEQILSPRLQVLNWIRVHLLRRPGYWISTVQDDGVHVVPSYDTIAHDPTGDCVCIPRTEAHPRDDGTIGWVLVHHSLDGREQREPQEA